MRVYIKGDRLAALMLFKRGSDADFARAEAIEAYNARAAHSLFDGLLSGSMDYAYIRDGKRLLVYTRSLRGPYIQASYFAEIGGDMEATSHRDITTPAMLADTFLTGHYINIKTA